MTVVELVERERARVRARVVGAGAGAAVAGAAVVAAAGAWMLAGARWLTLPRAVPVLVWLLAAAAVAGAVLWTRLRLGRDASRSRVAAAIERERSLRDGQLRGALETADSGPLGRLAAGQLAHQLAPQGNGPDAPALAPALHRANGARLAMAGGAAAVALALVGVSAATSADGFAAVLHPADAWRGTLLPPIRFSGAPGAIVRGERLRLHVDAPGRRTITVAHRQTGRAWRESVIPVSAAGRAVVDVGAVEADLALAATDGRATSDTARVHVTDRAFVGDVSIRAEYPGYLGRAAEDLPTGELVRVPRGTALVVRGRASTALDSVTLGDSTRRLPLAVDGHQFSGRLIAESSGRWAWRAAGPGGPVQDVPAALEIEVLPDSAPLVEITRPTADSVVDGLAPVRVSLSASDDHGLAGVALRVWKERADGRRDPAEESRLAGGVPVWSGEATVDLAPRGLQPGDRLSVQAVAVDASPWRQAGTSRVIVLRVPSASEMRERARDAADSAVAKAVAAAAASKDLQQKTSEAARSREQSKSGSQQGGGSSGEKGSMSYDAAEKAKALAQQQRQLQQQVQSLQEEAKALERQLKQAGALDTSLSRQMQDVQKLLRDALTPELAEQLKNLEQSANNLQSGESRQALEQLAAQQRALREQLEKSVEMLKRAALEGSMQTLRDEAKDLAQAERKEADRLEGKQEAPPQGQQQPNQQGQQQPGDQRSDAQRAKELADRSRDLSKEIDELQRRLKNERADFGAQKVGEAGDHAEKSADEMQRAAQREQAQQRAAQQQAGEQKGGEQKGGEQKGGDQKAGEPQSGQPQSGQQQGAQRTAAQQRQVGAQQGGQQQQGGQPQAGQQQGSQQQNGQQGADAARRAADEMQRAADQLASARQGQIEQWKSELSGELDQAIQETMQMAREQQSLEQKARQGQDPASLRGEQSAVQQGVEQTAQRLEQAGKKSSLLSQRAQRAMGEAKQQVAQASQALQQQSGQQAGQQSGQSGAADAMREASEALNRAAASLVRDRERVNGAQSASGFQEMLEQLKQLAQQQGQINQQAQGLPIPMPGASGQGARDAMRQLAKQQRGVAEKLEDVGDNDPTGKSDALAREARQLAQALERQGADPSTINRQQQLYRRLLDAGRTMEQDERDESGKREARAGGNVAGTAPADGPAAGKAATKFAVPSWADLRGLSPEERRLVIEYFRRLNTDKP